MSAENFTPRRRGRPPRNEIETLMTKAWFIEAGHCLGSYSGYAFEQVFSHEKVVTSDGVTKRPCKFDKYKNGQHTPNRDVIEAVDKVCQGTKSIIEHPFWEVAKCPCIDLKKLYEQLLKLRPELIDLLFYTDEHGRAKYQRRRASYMNTFEALGKEGDIEALTACIGLIQEAKFYGDDLMWFIYTRPTFAVFRRSISEPPFIYLAEELYAYLVKYILDNPTGEEISDNIQSDTIDGLAFLSNTRLLLIEDYDLLKHYFVAPRSCLHVAERYLDATTIKRIWDLTVSGHSAEVPKLQQFKKLTRALKRWEMKHMPPTRH